MSTDEITNARLCGAGRVKEGVYIEVATSANGLPLEHFLFCPPVPIDAKELGISAIGLNLVQRGDAYHIIDWVGESHYPDVADFLQEGNFLNFSRRAPRNFDFSKLSPASRIIFAHKRAHIENWQEYQQREPFAITFCPKLHEHHAPHKGTEMCARF